LLVWAFCAFRATAFEEQALLHVEILLIQNEVVY